MSGLKVLEDWLVRLLEVKHRIIGVSKILITDFAIEIDELMKRY